MYIPRILQLGELLAKKSFFLFGPRSTGKSSLIKIQLAEKAEIINLLRNDIYIRLEQNPSALENLLPVDNSKFIVIDEIQRIPALLNEVHRLIEEKQYKFLLTGSSARKLLTGDANLLAGRARKAHIFPLTYQELRLAKQFSLDRYLISGGLPQVYLSTEPHEELMAYVDTYLKDEIQREALVRNISAFTRFFTMCAETNGQVVNFSAIANDCSMPVSTVREYYQILEDTLIGFMLPAWLNSRRTKALKSAKFYLFDIGVANYLNNITSNIVNYVIPEKSSNYGVAFEHFIINEIRSFISYNRKSDIMSYWRTSDGVEVDLIINDAIAIEIKTTEKVASKHCRGLQCLMRHKDCKQYIIVSRDKFTKNINDITAFYWEDFLQQLWQGEIF